MDKFADLGISRELRCGVQNVGFDQMTPIQAKVIPLILQGKDVIGQAQTGTGKTLAFGLPVLNAIRPRIRKTQALILCPTRELAVQVAEELQRILTCTKGITVLPIYGGQPIQRQLRALKKGIHVIVGTPGRTIDHLNRGTLSLNNVKIAVLDEADEMLNMGFIDDVEMILQRIPVQRQTLLFSATMPQPILKLTRKYQREPEFVTVVEKQLTVPRVTQYYVPVHENIKVDVLCRLIDTQGLKSSLVFCNTKKKVDKVVQALEARGYLAQGLHGDMTQPQRTSAMNRFKRNSSEILVATDVAARGIDVEDIDAVFNYDLPQNEEYYVHRIGRTARAGRPGRAFSFVAGNEVARLRGIEKYAATTITFLPLPSATAQHEVRATSLRERVNAMVDKGNITAEYAHEIELLVQKGYDLRDIATALLAIAVQGDATHGLRSTERISPTNRLGTKKTGARTARWMN